MPITHILMYRFRDGVPEGRIDEHLAFIESLRGRIDGLLELSCGRDHGGGDPRGVHRFTHGFVMKFSSREALKAYGASDLHEELVAGFRDDMDDKIVMDFEFG